MNLPGAQIDLPALTPQDETDIIEFGIPNDVDYITASFVRKASEVPQERFNHYWREVDQDQSGQIDFEEFLVW